MSERLSPGRRSFKQFLPALFLQIQRHGPRRSIDDHVDPQCLPDLSQIRQEVKTGKFDLNALVNRLAKLTQRIVGASGVGVWLFTGDEVFLYAGSGSASNDERLRLEVISKLANACRPSPDSASRATNRSAIATGYNESDPEDNNSLLVEPIPLGQNVAGALAALSDECNAFTQREVANLHMLADLLGQAVSKAAEAGTQESVILESAGMLQLIERIVPALRRMLENDENVRHTSHGFLQREPGRELSSGDIPTKRFPDLQSQGEDSGATRPLDRARSADNQEPPALADSNPSSPASEIIGSRVGAWAAGKSKISTLLPEFRRSWVRTTNLAKSRATRTINWAAACLPSVRRGLRYAQVSFLQAIDVSRIPFRTVFKSRSTRRAVFIAAPVAAVLVIVVALLILRIRSHSSEQATASGLPTTAVEKPAPPSSVPSDAREEHVPEPVGTPVLLQVSHTHVTDRATEDAVRSLSRYELTGLRHRAEYGDDSAAFQLGMVYEIGRGLSQSCATAAQWVARAAGEGNAAAQYNLGLRYRDGDGVPVNKHESVKWLQRAASHQSPYARAALGMPTTQAHVISTQAAH